MLIEGTQKNLVIFHQAFFIFKHLNYQYYRLDAGGETQT